MKKRVFDFDKYIKDNRSRFFDNMARLEIETTSRLVRERPRDPLKERLLCRLDNDRRRKMINSGELQRLGPRKWRLKIL